jgi:glyoxylase-like metal-dependent hydrolase (beta-lactamase superfamily II)
MGFQQFYLGCLSHASYLTGSGGIAAVVEPQCDGGIYIEYAVQNGFRIAHAIETHLHADSVSGHAELASLTGDTIYSTPVMAGWPRAPGSVLLPVWRSMARTTCSSGLGTDNDCD